MTVRSRALAQSQNVLPSFRVRGSHFTRFYATYPPAIEFEYQHISHPPQNSRNSSTQLLASLKPDSQLPRSPQLYLELAQLSRAPARRVRYLPELDMEIEVVEPPRKAIVDKHVRVRALRERWDEKEIHPTHPPSPRPKPMRYVWFRCGAIHCIGVSRLTGYKALLDSSFRNDEREYVGR